MHEYDQQQSTADDSSSNRLRNWALASVLFVFALSLVVGSVYLWQSQEAAKLKQQRLALSQQQFALTQEMAGLKVDDNAAAAISTKDWKTYCDDKRATCFKYPSKWVVSTEGSTGDVAVISIKNPKKSVQITYASPPTKNATQATFRTITLQDFEKPSSALKIVGGYFVASLLSDPFYVVTTTANAPAIVGQNSQFPLSVSYGALNGNGESAFGARALSSFDTPAAARAWFNAPDTQTALRALQTLSAK